MVLPAFSKDYSSPADQAWRTGEGPYQGTLGPNRSADTDPTAFTNRFVTELRSNPDYKNFYSKNIFSSDTAKASQDKINTSSTEDSATFKNPLDNTFANDFLSKYSEGVARGLIEEDRAVRPDNLARLTTEPATAASSAKDPNTANKFPSQGVAI